jgi:LuxR family transcriptional regulator, maltose regulon positive regulatory protein
VSTPPVGIECSLLLVLPFGGRAGLVSQHSGHLSRGMVETFLGGARGFRLRRRFRGPRRTQLAGRGAARGVLQICSMRMRRLGAGARSSLEELATTRTVPADNISAAAGTVQPSPFGDGFSIVESKLFPPPPREGIITRHKLIEQLHSHPGPFVSVSAAPGYGKTSLLAQWVQEDPRPFAWVSLDDDDNDPNVLLAYIAIALDRIESIDPVVFDSIAAPGGDIHRSALPMVASALAHMHTPFVLILDDVHVLKQPSCLDALHVLVQQMPEGSRVVVSGRSEPPLSVARMRIQGLIMDVGRQELQMDGDEANELLRAADVELSSADTDDLVRKTEGWPAGLYMAALAFTAQGRKTTDPVAFSGEDWLVSDYLRSEVLSALPPDDVVFLTRTALLTRMSGPLCDAILESRDSGHKLQALERSNLFLTPLDRRREWYRYHHLFRDMLLLELQHREPERITMLIGRAADWCEANGRPEAAVGYAQAAGDVDRVAALVAQCGLSAYQRGRGATVEGWLDWIDRHGSIEEYPPTATIAAWLMALRGRPAESERWAEAALKGSFIGPAPDGSPSIEPWLAMLRALQCRDGVDSMRVDAELAVGTMASGSGWRPTALLLLGMSLLFEGRIDEADGIFADAAEEGERVGAPNASVAVVSERALIAIERGAWVEAEELAMRADSLARRFHVEEDVVSPLLSSVRARIAQHQGDALGARETLTRAGRVRSQINHALSFFGVQILIELARAHIATSDATGARTILRDADQILRRRPDLRPLFEEHLADTKGQLETMRGKAVGVSALTAAELRLLPYLPTHLTFREIGARLHVSPHTVKSQAIATYRKLGVTSRGEAIERAKEVGLL